ncbi:MAG: energy transducer TonB [Gemmatimonadales bacterium]|nr:MAG: energy transducer TonB [Gemmatimonadales bacterium]
MFEILVESKPAKQRSTGQFVVSVIVHGLVITGAVMATKGAAEVVRERLQDTTLVFLAPPKPEAPPEAPPPEAIVSANPPPRGFQTVVAVQDIPTEIPPINLNERFDPKDFTGTGVAGGVAVGVVGGTGPVTGETYLEAQVDDPPDLISAGPRRYPPVLERAGIGGRVVAQFVIDTTGHPEAAGFRVLSTTNPAFNEPAREMIMKSVFRPGRVRGQAVRVQVQQAVSFNP